MNQLYNIALLPLTKSDELIRLANRFAENVDTYLLGPNSLPHITLCHFMAQAMDMETFWQEAQSCSSNKFELDLFEVSYLTKNEENWISLLPKQREELTKLHCLIAKIIKTPLNRSYTDYDPHLTLLNTKSKITPKIPDLPIHDTFILSLGTSDKFGQFTSIIY
jgi:2'-5' RNA ligase